MQCKRFAVTARNDETVSALVSLGFEVLTTVPAQGLPDETADHPDCLMCVTGEKRAVVHDSQTEIINRLSAAGYSVTVASYDFGAYPRDIAFNAAMTDGFVLAKRDFIHPAIAEETGRKIVNTKQGYAKCSVAFVGRNGVITDDVNIDRAFRENGFDTLLVEKGDVFLSDIHYGFFGGATGTPDENSLYLNGELKYHRDEEKIRAFLEKHGVKLTEIKKGKITDTGSILFL